MKKSIILLPVSALIIPGICLYFVNHYVMLLVAVIAIFYFFITVYRTHQFDDLNKQSGMDVLEEAYKSLIIAQMATGISNKDLSNDIKELIFTNQTGIKDIQKTYFNCLSPVQSFKIYFAAEAVLRAGERGLSMNYILVNFKEKGEKLESTWAKEIYVNKQVMQVVR